MMSASLESGRRFTSRCPPVRDRMSSSAPVARVKTARSNCGPCSSAMTGSPDAMDRNRVASSFRAISSDRKHATVPCRMASAAQFSAIKLLPVPVLAPMVTYHVRASPCPPPVPRHAAFHAASGVGTASMGASFSASNCTSVSPDSESNVTLGASAPMGVASPIRSRTTSARATPSGNTTFRSHRSLTGEPSHCTSRITRALGTSLAMALTIVAPPSSGSCHTNTSRPLSNRPYSARHCDAPGRPTTHSPACHPA